MWPGEPFGAPPERMRSRGARPGPHCKHGKDLLLSCSSGLGDSLECSMTINPCSHLPAWEHYATFFGGYFGSRYIKSPAVHIGKSCNSRIN